MAPPSAFEPSPQQVSGFFWRGGGGTGSLKLCLPSTFQGARGCPGYSVPPPWRVVPPGP